MFVFLRVCYFAKAKPERTKICALVIDSSESFRLIMNGCSASRRRTSLCSRVFNVKVVAIINIDDEEKNTDVHKLLVGFYEKKFSRSKRCFSFGHARIESFRSMCNLSRILGSIEIIDESDLSFTEGKEYLSLLLPRNRSILFARFTERSFERNCVVRERKENEDVAKHVAVHAHQPSFSPFISRQVGEKKTMTDKKARL